MVKIWRFEDGDEEASLVQVGEVDFGESVNSVAWGWGGVVAVGLVGGGVQVWNMGTGEENEKENVCLMKLSSCHLKAVNELAWRPIEREDGKMQLASCSDDHAVKIFEIDSII